ncbi:hypothetical protein HZS_1931, partial [Henneguya salminicola]
MPPVNEIKFNEIDDVLKFDKDFTLVHKSTKPNGKNSNGNLLLDLREEIPEDENEPNLATNTPNIMSFNKKTTNPSVVSIKTTEKPPKRKHSKKSKKRKKILKNRDMKKKNNIDKQMNELNCSHFVDLYSNAKISFEEYKQKIHNCQFSQNKSNSLKSELIPSAVNQSINKYNVNQAETVIDLWRKTTFGIDNN